MILTCPSCSTRYLVDPRAIGSAGRRVRCVKCGEVWQQEAPPPDALAASAGALPPPAAASAPVPPPPPPPDPAVRPAEPSLVAERPGGPAESVRNLPAVPRRQPVARGWIGWLILLLLVLAVAAGGIFFREQIVRLFPPAAQLYRMVGTAAPAAPGSGLEIRGVTSERKVEQGQEVVDVRGEVFNVSDSAQALPPLRVAFGDAERRELAFSRLPLERNSLPAGGRLAFSARLPKPPDGAATLIVTFDTGAPAGGPAAR